MENINIDGLDVSKIIGDKGMSIIKQNSPAVKINITEDNKLFVTGFALACENQEKIKYDVSDLNNYTLLVMDARHIAECLLIIAGAIKCASSVFKADIDIYKCIYKLKHKVSDKVVFYYEITKEAKSVIRYIEYETHKSWADEPVLQNLMNIIEKIWFLPFGEIDALQEKVCKELGGEKSE